MHHIEVGGLEMCMNMKSVSNGTKSDTSVEGASNDAFYRVLRCTSIGELW